MAFIAAALALAAPATAATWRVVLTTDVAVLRADFIGVLQPDGDRIRVTGVRDFATLDIPVDRRLTYPTLLSFTATSSTAPGFISLSGRDMNLLADSQSNQGGDAFLLDSRNDRRDFAYGFGTGEFGEAIFELADWRITAIPEPGTWALLLTGFGAIGIATRRRRTAAA